MHAYIGKAVQVELCPKQGSQGERPKVPTQKWKSLWHFREQKGDRTLRSVELLNSWVNTNSDDETT